MDCTRLQIASRFLHNPVETVLLTPCHTNGETRCLLFFHGAGESPQAILDNLPLTDSETRNLTIVLPFMGNSFGLDIGEGKRFHAFLLKELIPFLFAHNGKGVSFHIGGISMGAYIALQLGLECQEFVSGILSISGAYDLRKAARFGRVCGLDIPPVVADMENRPGERADALLTQFIRVDSPPLYFACGDGDLFRDANRITALRAVESGYSVRWEETPGLHNWDYWREALPSALQWAAVTGGALM